MATPTHIDVDISYCKSLLQLAIALDSVAGPLCLREFGEDDWGIEDIEPRSDFLRSCISNSGATADQESLDILWGMMDDDFARVLSIDAKLVEFLRLVAPILEPLHNIDQCLIEHQHARHRAEIETERTTRLAANSRDRERCRTKTSWDPQFAPFEFFIVAFADQQCHVTVSSNRRKSPFETDWKSHQDRITAKLKTRGSIMPASYSLSAAVGTTLFEMTEIQGEIGNGNPQRFSENLTDMRAAAVASRDRTRSLEWFSNQLNHFAARVQTYRKLHTMVVNVLYQLGQVFRMLDVVALACQYTQRRLASQ